MRNMILFIVHAEKVGLISLKAKMTANITRNIKLENGPGYVKFDNFLVSNRVHKSEHSIWLVTIIGL